MDLEFNLEKMDNLYLEATRYQTGFLKAIENLDTTINDLEKSWISDETNTYQEFKKLYDDKKKTLLDAYENIVKYTEKINEKIKEYTDSSERVKNSFE